MSDVLFAVVFLKGHCRVDIDVSQFPFADLSFPLGQCDRLGQQFLELLCPDSLTPLGQSRRVQRGLMLHRAEAAEILPVRVLHPPIDNASSDRSKACLR